MPVVTAAATARVMKLFFSRGACSLSPHIVLREAGLPFDLERVDLRTHLTEKGTDFDTINPKGYVPTLQLDDGSVLTEGPAIVQYIADQKPDARLAPPNGTLGRYRLQEWLTFIGTELHKSFSPLFDAATPEETKKLSLEKIGKRLEYVSQQLGEKQYLLGDDFTGPDAYLFVMLLWAKGKGPDVSRWPNLGAYFDRIRARPAVTAAFDAEGLK